VTAALLLPAHLVQASPTWQQVPSLPVPLDFLAATAGSDGTLYAIGGEGCTTTCGYQSTVNSFKPGTDTAWQTAPSLPTTLEAPAATTGADGTIYVIGGYGWTCDVTDFCSNAALSTVYSFKPGTDTTWQTAPSLPAARWDLAATTGTDGTLYAIGGMDNSYTPQSTVYSFKPGTDTSWHTAPSLPTARFSLAATTASDGTLYAIGGNVVTNTNPQSTVYSFKPGMDITWQTAPSLPAARDDLAAATDSDGTIYAIGGQAVSPVKLLNSSGKQGLRTELA
jgi:N-acetylneuraminic acid mutarotase